MDSLLLRLPLKLDTKGGSSKNCSFDCFTPIPSHFMGDPLTFSDAISLLKRGNKLSRNGWNGKGQYIELQFPDEHSKMKLPYIYISTVDGAFVPWVASHTDMLTDDWFVA
jgi:hypothetical protein